MRSRLPILAAAALVLSGGAAWLLATRSAGPPSSVAPPPRGPAAPNEWLYGQRAYPSGVMDYRARDEAVAAARALRDAARFAPSPVAGGDFAWTALGPVNVGGRITDIVADPAEFNTVYAGAASGGIWKSSDGGATWNEVFDGAGSPSIGALALDPADPQVLYAGTGEANPGGGSVAYGGDGVWKTTDGGATWSSLGLAGTRSIGEIALAPTHPGRVFVAATGSLYSKGPDRGLYRSNDGGANWTKVLYLSDSTGCVDVAVDPANGNRVFAAMWERMRRPDIRRYGGPTSGLWRSLDGGDTWSQLTSGLPLSSTRPGRIGLAIAPSNPSVVYAIYADSTGAFAGFYRSTDGGSTWVRRPDGSLGGGSFYSSYGWWFGRIFVDPANADRVFAHGIELYRSTNGGSSWTLSSGSMHADHHAQWFLPSNPNFIWEGNDGGVYKSTNGGSAWTFVANLPITQFYTGEVHPTQPHQVYGGAQDNGTVRTLGGMLDDWNLIYGGDGHYVIVDPNNPSTIYAEYQYGAFVRSTDGGFSFSSATSGISAGDRRNWSTPVVVDPTSIGRPQTRLYFGTQRVYRSTNSASSWTAVSGDLSDGNPGANGVVYGTVTTLAAAPSDSATVYAGTDDGNVWVTTNYGSSWTRVDAALPDRWVTRVAVDPANDAVAYVTLSGFRVEEPQAHVFRTADWGASWTDISGNLPDSPANDLVVDPLDPSVLYLATDVGVFATANLGAEWTPLGTGLPDEVVVSDLVYRASPEPRLYAATYGRSFWRLGLAGLTDVAGQELGGPRRFELGPATPNPTAGPATLRLTLDAGARVRVEVLDVRGRRVATLADRAFDAGAHELRWDGRDEQGAAAAPGIYFARASSGPRQPARKLLVIH